MKAPVLELALGLDKPLFNCRANAQSVFVGVLKLTIRVGLDAIFHLLIRKQVHQDSLSSDCISRSGLYALNCALQSADQWDNLNLVITHIFLVPR